MNDVVELVSKLSNYNEYWYLHLIKLIAPSYRSEAINSLTKAFMLSETKEEVKIEVAKHLSNLENVEGYKFLMELIRVNKKSPYTIQGHLSIHNVDTTLGLKEIEDLMYLVVDKHFEVQQHFSENARNVLVELLYGFAAKSEADLEKVIEFCEKTAKDLKQRGYENTSDFNFFINRMVENFRSSDKTTKNISEFKPILLRLSYQTGEANN